MSDTQTYNEEFKQKYDVDYDVAPCVERCRQLGLEFDEVGAAQLAMFAKSRGLAEGTFQQLLCLHAEHVHVLFNPRSYTFLGRVLLAIHFLFCLKLKPKK